MGDKHKKNCEGWALVIALAAFAGMCLLVLVDLSAAKAYHANEASRSDTITGVETRAADANKRVQMDLGLFAKQVIAREAGMQSKIETLERIALRSNARELDLHKNIEAIEEFLESATGQQEEREQGAPAVSQ